MADPIFGGKVHNGRLVADDPKKLREHLYCLQGKPVDVIVRRQVKRRSSNEMRYYWGVVLKILSGHTGHTTEELHDHFKTRFLAQATGDFIKWKTRSTGKLSTVEMEEYLAKIRIFASTDLGCYVPEPNEVDF